MRPATRVTLVMMLTGAMVATAPFLVSNNLLPRRLFLHACAIAWVLVAGKQWKIPSIWLLVATDVVALWGVSPVAAASVNGLLDRLALVVLVTAVATGRVPRRSVLGALLSLGVSGALLGLAQQWVDADWWAATRPAGFFASRATAAAVVVAALPLAVLVLWRRPALLAVAVGVGVAFIATTRARTALGVLLLVLCALWWIVPRVRRPVALGGCIGLVFALAATPGPRLHWASGTPYVDSATSLATVKVGDRVDVWRAALVQVAHRPWGFGPGSFQAAFPSSAESLPDSLTGIEVESPHNDTLLLVYELGVQGLLLVAVALLPRRRRASTRTSLLRLSLLALALCGLAGKVVELPPTAAMAGVVVGLIQRRRHGVEKKRLWPWAAITAALALVFAWVDIRAVHASAVLKAARAVAVVDPRRALDQAERVLAESGDASEWLWASELAKGLGDGTRCERLARQALETFPFHRALLEQERVCSAAAPATSGAE